MSTTMTVEEATRQHAAATVVRAWLNRQGWESVQDVEALQRLIAEALAAHQQAGRHCGGCPVATGDEWSDRCPGIGGTR